MKNNLNINQLGHLKWHYIHKRFRTPFYTYLLWEGVSRHHNNNLKFPYEMGAVLYLDQELMFADNVWLKTQSLILSKLESDSSFIKSSFNEAYKLNRRIEKFVKEQAQKKFNTYSNNQLADNLEKYSQLCFSIGAFMIFPLFIEEHLENKVRFAITKKLGKKAPDIIHDLCISAKPSSTEDAELSLLKIAFKGSRKLSIKQDIERHIKEYGWLKNSAMNNNYYSEKDIYKRLEQLRSEDVPAKIKLILNNRRKNRNKIKKYQNSFGFSQKLISYIDTLQEAIFFRSWRTERFYRNIQYLSGFLDEITRRLGVKIPSEVFYILPTEITDLLRKELKMNKEIIRERKQGYLMWGDGEKTQIYSGNIVTIAKKKIKFLSTKNQDCDKIHGQIACRGKVIGKARVIRMKGEFGKIRLGEILVVPSTTPDYVPIMKKSAAIVTDEGGLTCHSAIMSRELGIPCIIGTKISTKILHDGDLIEVDADNGVIKILKRA